jgi:hypothetical protein
VIDKSTAILFGVLAIGAGAAIFVSRTPEPTPEPPPVAAPQTPAPPAIDPNTPLPAGHPPVGDMPAGHPPMGNMPAGHPPIGSSTAPPSPIKAEAGITWTAPARWTQVPHMSTMRIATYRIPKAAGDVEDPEMSVTRAGGDVEANAQRWVDQFDVASRPSVKRSTKTIGALKVHVVDGAGGFTTMSGEVEQGWAMLGAIVETADGSHFFKLTGPKKSVEAARAEFDALLASVKTK